MNLYKKKLIGKVIKNKMNKSIIVYIIKKIKHKIYEKFISRTIKLHVHDEYNKAKVGDFVSIKECRPISKTKSWTLLEIIKK